MGEVGLIVDSLGVLLIVIWDGGKLKCFEIAGINDNGNWLVI
jgi:hypothetical protein